MVNKMAITISPPHNTMDTEDLLVEYHRALDPLLRRCAKEYILIPEFTAEGRLHLHGVLLGYDPVAFWKRKKQIDLVGFSCVRDLDDAKGWMDYCYKHWDRANEMLNFRGYPISTIPVKRGRPRNLTKTIHAADNISRARHVWENRENL